MSDRVFLDTNILVYLYSNDEQEKKTAAIALMESVAPVVSTQVLSELANTLSRKFALPIEVVLQAVAEIQNACVVITVTPNTILQALSLVQKYRYSYYDSLILAAALSAGCNRLASEDMQHGQVIESTLTIHCPFPKR